MLGSSLSTPAGRLEDSRRADAYRRAKTVDWVNIGRILLLAGILAAGYPVRHYPITAGIDASWAYGLNYAHVKGLIFGREAIFTYGPLAWLMLPMDVGSNLRHAFVFQMGCWLAFGAIAGYVVLVRKAALQR